MNIKLDNYNCKIDITEKFLFIKNHFQLFIITNNNNVVDLEILQRLMFMCLLIGISILIITNCNRFLSSIISNTLSFTNEYILKVFNNFKSTYMKNITSRNSNVLFKKNLKVEEMDIYDTTDTYDWTGKILSSAIDVWKKPLKTVSIDTIGDGWINDNLRSLLEIKATKKRDVDPR